MVEKGQGPLETLEEPLYVSSPLGIRERIRMICRSCELEISGTVSRLASEPYPRGRGETKLRSTSSSLRICGCLSR